MLDGSLLVHKEHPFQESENVLFDIAISGELEQMHAKDLNAILVSFTNVIGLAQGRGSLHIEVEPTVGRLPSQSRIETLNHKREPIQRAA